MKYADYEYYKNTFAGELIPCESLFERHITVASLYLHSVTFGRIDEKDISEDVKMCACALAEAYFRDGERGNISSENNDGYSITYTQRSAKKQINMIVNDYLASTGLLYSGGR